MSYRNAIYNSRDQSIKLFTWDETGKRITRDVTFNPYLYLESPDGDKTSIYGTKVKKRTFNTQYDRNKYIADSGKVTNVATRIKVSGTKICEGNTSPMLGLTYWNMYDFSKEYQSLVAEKYKLGGALQVVNVGTSSPAEKAGFQFGDELAYIDDNVIKGGKDAKKDFSKQLDEMVKVNKPLKIKIWRIYFRN